MKSKKIGNAYLVRVDRGEEIVEELTKFCEKNNVTLGSIQGIGAVGEVTLGLFHTQQKKYASTEFKGDFEITSLLGNISTKDGKVYLHLHINIADEKHHTFGGHLNKAVVSATCEIMVYAIEGQVDRYFSEEIGLNLYDL